MLVAPGNAGTATENKCTNVNDLKISDNAAVADFCKKEKVRNSSRLLFSS